MAIRRSTRHAPCWMRGRRPMTDAQRRPAGLRSPLQGAFVNDGARRRINRGIFPPIPMPVIARRGEAPEIPGHGAEQNTGQIDDQRDVEHGPPSEPVGQPTEDERAAHRADHIEGGGRADLLR
jgi:hypothetical protein